TLAPRFGQICPLRPREAQVPRTVTGVSDPLKNAHVLVTGATGFVGQAVVEKLLSAYPSTRLTLLVRPRGEAPALWRVRNRFQKDCFPPWRERIGAEAAAAEFAQRINILSGALDHVPALPGDLAVVIHAASTVSFDLPIHEAFNTNLAGPLNLS